MLNKISKILITMFISLCTVILSLSPAEAAMIPISSAPISYNQFYNFDYYRYGTQYPFEYTAPAGTTITAVSLSTNNSANYYTNIYGKID